VKIIDYNPLYKDPIPTKVDSWYDRRTRSWIVQLMDEEGNQIGDAYYTGIKEDAIREEKELKERYNI